MNENNKSGTKSKQYKKETTTSRSIIDKIMKSISKLLRKVSLAL